MARVMAADTRVVQALQQGRLIERDRAGQILLAIGLDPCLGLSRLIPYLGQVLRGDEVFTTGCLTLFLHDKSLNRRRHRKRIRTLDQN